MAYIILLFLLLWLIILLLYGLLEEYNTIHRIQKGKTGIFILFWVTGETGRNHG